MTERRTCVTHTSEFQLIVLTALCLERSPVAGLTPYTRSQSKEWCWGASDLLELVNLCIQLEDLISFSWNYSEETPNGYVVICAQGVWQTAVQSVNTAPIIHPNISLNDCHHPAADTMQPQQEFSNFKV